MRGLTYMVSTWRGVGVGGKAKLICYWTWGVGESAGSLIEFSLHYFFLISCILLPETDITLEESGYSKFKSCQ